MNRLRLPNSVSFTIEDNMMAYYDKDLGLVMCESELYLDIDALRWDNSDVTARYVEPAVVVDDSDDEIPF